MPESRPVPSVMVAPMRAEEPSGMPHFSESFSWRMKTTVAWMLLMAAAAGGLWWYGRSVSESFLGQESLEAIWREAFRMVLIVGPMAVIMLGGGLDLSVGAVAALAAVLTASGLAEGQSPHDAFTMAMLVSGGIGLLHALLVGVAMVNPVVLTLVTALLIQGAAVLRAGGQPILLGQNAGFLEFMHKSPLLVALFAGASFLLIQLAQAGRGSGGMPVDRQRWYRRTLFIALPYVLCSLAAGAVGCSLAGRFPMAVPETDMEMTFMVIGAAVIGGNCTGRRFGTVIGALAGVAILAAIKHLVLMEAVDTVGAGERTLILAASAGAALLLSQTIYGVMNLLYRRSLGPLAA